MHLVKSNGTFGPAFQHRTLFDVMFYFLIRMSLISLLYTKRASVVDIPILVSMMNLFIRFTPSGYHLPVVSVSVLT